MDVTVLASGAGTNFQNLVFSGVPVTHLITDNPDAGVLSLAQDFGVYWTVLPFKQPRQEWGEDLISIMGMPDLIVCAGFMRILPATVVKTYRGRIINVHPSLLPAFKGSTNAITEGYKLGCRTFGATVHRVTEDVDGGSILAQHGFNVDALTPLHEIKEKVHAIEHVILPETTKRILNI
jgi:phosphoribosylglycinamide formyltransferase 1